MSPPVGRSILVASDLSVASDEVVESASTLAAATGAELHLLHAFDFRRALSGASPIGLTRAEVRVLHIIPRIFEMTDFSFDRAVIGSEVDREIEAAPAREIVRHAREHPAEEVLSAECWAVDTRSWGRAVVARGSPR